MRVVILAAGKGERLMPLTADRPKCMVNLLGTPILKRILGALDAVGLKDISIVTGYKKEIIEKLGHKTYYNPEFASSNMVYSLQFAKEEFYKNEDVLILYSDICFSPEIIQKMKNSTGDFVLAINSDWKKLWALRMDDPLSDAESLVIDKNKIVEIGKKVDSYDKVHGQYMGVIRIGKSFAKEFIEEYEKLSEDQTYDGKTKKNMFMTSFLQHFFDKHKKYAEPLLFGGGWIEVDSVEDLKIYEQVHAKGKLSEIISLS